MMDGRLHSSVQLPTKDLFSFPFGKLMYTTFLRVHRFTVTFSLVLTLTVSDNGNNHFN